MYDIITFQRIPKVSNGLESKFIVAEILTSVNVTFFTDLSLSCF
jgi:hypothetical protein